MGMFDFITDFKNKITGTTPNGSASDAAIAAPSWGDANNNNTNDSAYTIRGGSRRCTKKHKHADACNKIKGRKGKKGRKSNRKRH